MRKKGQITLFVIIGLVALLLLFLVINFKEQFFRVDESQAVDMTPDGFRNFVENCLTQDAQKASRLLGDKGGFVQTPDYVSQDSRRYLELGKGGPKLPLWYYEGRYKGPTMGSMETEISSYVQENLGQCLDNFTAFRNKFFVNAKGNPRVQTSINENDIAVSLDYEVELTSRRGNETTEYENFVSVLPIRLKRVYELARDILESENEEFFLEEETFDLISMNPETPVTGMDFSCSALSWRTNDVRQEIKDMLFYNLPRIRFQDTDYPAFMAQDKDYEKLRGYDAGDVTYNDVQLPDDGPADAYEYFNLFFDVSDEDYDDLRANVDYIPASNLELKITPSGNGLLESKYSEGSSEFLNFMCFQFYHFVYDLRYLVRVNIYDPMSLNGRGYAFSFAMPVIIRNNRPDRRETSYVDFSEPRVYNDPCETSTGEPLSVTAEGIFEGYNNVDLKDVNISYDCIKHGCYLGQTEAVDGEYKLVTELPELCVGGFITAEREGYLTTKKQYDGSEDFTIRLKKTSPFKVSVKKRTMDNMERDVPIAEYQKVIAHIYSEEDDVSYFEEFESGETKRLELAAEDGNYSIDLMLVDTVHESLWGGYKGNWTYDYQEASGNDEVTFYVLEYLPRPITQDAKIDMFNYLRTNNEYREKLEPSFR